MEDTIKLANQIANDTNRNGGTMCGEISKLAELLSEHGYQVTDTGAMMVYPYEGDIKFTKDGVVFSVKTTFSKPRTDA